MLNMRFKDFVWPNNPHSCSLTTMRDVATHKYPGYSYRLENLGMGRRVLSGNGEFYGENAYKTMKELLQVFQQEGAGRLIHPIIEMNQAIFSELELVQEPRADYVAYRFVFLEDGSGTVTDSGTSGSARTHVVKSGENLWEIAALYGTTAQQLLTLNSWIQNPNKLTTGKQVLLA